MKNIFLLLGITIALVTSASAQTDPRFAKTSGLNSASNSNVYVSRVKQPPGRKRIVYYITNQSVTGSHLPVVYRVYEGHSMPMFDTSPGSGYGFADIGLTGSLSVGGALRSLDPAISSSNR